MLARLHPDLRMIFSSLPSTATSTVYMILISGFFSASTLRFTSFSPRTLELGTFSSCAASNWSWFTLCSGGSAISRILIMYFLLHGNRPVCRNSTPTVNYIRRNHRQYPVPRHRRTNPEHGGFPWLRHQILQSGCHRQ